MVMLYLCPLVDVDIYIIERNRSIYPFLAFFGDRSVSYQSTHQADCFSYGLMCSLVRNRSVAKES